MNEKKSTPIQGERKETRTRTWTFVLYPESAPTNWRELIDELHIEWVESPLHDKDINANGEVKKSHWHILLLFGGVKAYDQVKEITDLLNAPIPERCHNAKALVRYMAHLDNPEKAQYSQSDIIAHGGVDLSDLLRPSASERYSIIREMLQYVKDNGITEYQDLADYAMVNEFDRWFPLLCDNSSYVVNQYIKSQRHRSCPQIVEDQEDPEDRELNQLDDIKVDPETGEVIGGVSDAD